MQAIIDFCDLVSSFIHTAVDFIVQLFQDLIQLIVLLGKALTSFPAYVSALLPPGYVTALTLCVTITIVFIIIGRTH